MSVSIQEIEKLAHLGRLYLTDEEKKEYQEDLNNIIDFANKLNDIDTAKVDATENITELSNVFRKDEVIKPMDREKILQNASQKEYGCFYVTKVVD